MLVEEKRKFWREKVDCGVFNDADFNFLSLEIRFDRNDKKDFGFLKNDFRNPNPEF